MLWVQQLRATTTRTRPHPQTQAHRCRWRCPRCASTASRASDPREPLARSGMRDRTAPRRPIAYAGAMTTPRFRDFERIVFFTGAGLSAESGIPTCRGHGGIWNEYDYRDYACQSAFERDPEKVWD